MTTAGLSHINFRADRLLLDALKDFYCNAVGLQVGERPPFHFSAIGFTRAMYRSSICLWPSRAKSVGRTSRRASTISPSIASAVRKWRQGCKALPCPIEPRSFP